MMHIFSGQELVKHPDFDCQKEHFMQAAEKRDTSIQLAH